MKKVKAIFKGENGSCGYLTKMEYELVISKDTGSLIVIKAKKGGGYCEYSSIISFLDNWDNIRIVN